MILSAINWLTISIDLLLVVFVIVCLLMSMIILMQRPKNEGLGAAFGSGTTDQLFGARTTNVLQKATVYLATLFFVLTLTLAVLVNKRNSQSPTLISQAPETPKVEEKAASIAEEAEKAGENKLEPEAVTKPAEAPAPVEGTPAPAPAPEAADTPKPEGETAPAPAEGETKPAEEQTPPPADEPKAPEGQ
jgi:preprotein translocase subunit SecG